ncbi:MAG: nodulation protein NfeD [Deltaproteobacteria bacterium]|nr:MAG: nodulation protein NfeD [Deltaproteobacteria bacterium]
MGRKVGFFLILMLGIGNLELLAATPKPTVYVLTATGSINPGLAEFIRDGIRTAERAQAEVLVIQLDTPGGLDTSMRQIVQGIINAKIPILVYVSPKGARAASAGLMITMAAHIAAMAPGTNIGAATPVSLGFKKADKVMGRKAINDMVAYVQALAKERGRNPKWVEKAVRESASIPADEALRLKVIDLLADNLEELLAKVDNRPVRLGKTTRKLQTAAAKLVPIKEGLRITILKRIADPNIAFILMMIGLAGLYFELAHPGVIFPGVVGALALLLAFFAFQTLPINMTGILLILLGFIFFLLEIWVTSYGLLAVAGVASLLLGSIMLFRKEEPGMAISLGVLLPTVIVFCLFFIGVAFLVFRAQIQRPTTGASGLIGEQGIAQTALAPEGRVFVHGEYWKARSDEPIAAGETIEVIKVINLKLLVRRIKSS